MIAIIKTNIFEKWFRQLKNKKTRITITNHLARMRNGNFGVTRNIGDGVFEKKINYAGGFRLYYFLKLKNKLILLCGGDKSTQKKDIKQAIKIKKGLS